MVIPNILNIFLFIVWPPYFLHVMKVSWLVAPLASPSTMAPIWADGINAANYYLIKLKINHRLLSLFKIKKFVLSCRKPYIPGRQPCNFNYMGYR